MDDIHKLSPVEAAKRIIETTFPQCEFALLAGSTVRGEATKTSDLDIVILQSDLKSAYRESFVQLGWPVEAFIHTELSLMEFFESDRARGRPSLPQMVKEGVLLKGEQTKALYWKEKAEQILIKGPEQWTRETIDEKRYFITDLVDDLRGCDRREEQLFIASEIKALVSEFILGTNQRWLGRSKWTIRLLKAYDEKVAHDLLQAFEQFYQRNDKARIISFVEQILEPFGGFYFAGFTRGKEKKAD